MAIGINEAWYSGQEILSGDMGFNDQGRISQDQVRTSDFWTNGVLKDPNGLSNLSLSVDAITSTCISVSQGVAFSNGYRISIDMDQAFDPNFLSATTNGICTQHSSGNKVVPLANYSLGTPNYVWAEYLTQISTARTSVSFIDGSIHYPDQYDGYGIIVTTNNPPGYSAGITNSVFLGTVYGQGIGQPLNGSANGLTDAGKVYANIRPILPPNTNLGNGSVRGSSSNSGGSQREILQGTVSAPDLRFAAVTASAIDTTQSFVFALGNSSVFIGTTTPPPVTTKLIVDNASRSQTYPASFTNSSMTNIGDNAFIVVGKTEFTNEGVALGTIWDPVISARKGVLAMTGYNTISFDVTGKVGINNVTANYPLDVHGDINTDGKLREVVSGVSYPLIPAGTTMVFGQITVPPGWSVTNVSDFFLRVVNNGTTGGASTPGTSPPSGGFSLQHSHTVNNHSHPIPTQNATGLAAMYIGGGGPGVSVVTTHNHTGSTDNTSPGTDNQLSNNIT